MKTNILNIFVTVCAVSTLISASAAYGQNLIANGGFEKGNIGFGSNYTFGDDCQDTAKYGIASSPHDLHGGGADFGDHTSGKGMMLVVNAAETDHQTIWRQEVRVKPHGVYQFTGWAATWSMSNNDGSGDASPARVRVTINGKPVVASFTVPAADGKWARFTGTWSSGANTNATIQIVDLNIEGFGNDFAIDDLSLTPSTIRPAPKSNALRSAPTKTTK